MGGEETQKLFASYGSKVHCIKGFVCYHCTLVVEKQLISNCNSQNIYFRGMMGFSRGIFSHKKESSQVFIYSNCFLNFILFSSFL